MRKLIFCFWIVILITSVGQARTTVSWWQFWTDPGIKPTLDSIIAEFEAANPDIDIEPTDLTWSNGHEKIVIAFASGTGPDIVELGSDWIAEFAANDRLTDISEAIQADSSQYHGWGMATYEEGVYAFPWILGTRVLFVNGDLAARAGYEADFVPANWDQMKELTFKIDSLGDDIYGWGSNAPEKHRLYKKFLPLFWSAGGEIFSPDRRFCLITSDYGVKALEYYKMLHDSVGYVADQRGIEDAFLDGKIGCIFSGDWLLKRIEVEQRPINFTTSFIPGPDLPGKSFMGGEFLAINADSDNREASVKFIRFLTSAENQIRFCKANRSANPSSRAAQADPYFQSNPNLITFIKQLTVSKHPPVDPDWVYIETAIEEAVEDALFGMGLPAEALLQARYKIDEMMGR